MANKFQITISAIDRATEVVRRINANMDRLTRPITQMRQAIRNLATETGFDKVAASIAGTAKSAIDLGGRLFALLGPLAILFGGGTLAGLAAFVTEWARLGAQITMTSDLIGTTASNLQSLRGAAQSVGVGADAMTSGLKSLGDTMEDALFGRNQQALVALNRLNVGIHKTEGGSIDAARGVRDLSGAIASIKNAQVQSLIARTFGIEALLPLLRQGPRAIAEYENKVASLGGVMSGQAVAAANAFHHAMGSLQIATTALRNSIAERLLPVLQPMLEQFIKWVAINRDVIASNAAEFFEGFAHWVRQIDFKAVAADLKAFAQDVRGCVDALGGFKNAAILLIAVLNAGLIAAVVSLGASLVKLGYVIVPFVIKGFGLLAVALDVTLVPAVLRGLLAVGLYTGSLASLAAGIPVLGSLLAGLSTAFMATGAAIAATPIGWLIAGVAAIAFSVYAIYKNWDAIGDFFKNKFASVKAAFDKGFMTGIVQAIKEFNPISMLAGIFNGLSKWLFGIDLSPAGEKMMAGLIRGMKSVVGMLPKSALKFLGLEDWAKQTASVAPAAAPATKAPAVAPAAKAPAAPSVGNAALQAPLQTSARTPALPPLGIRNNNPGNLREWGSMPKAGGFATFPTPEAGLDAMIKNLRVQQSRHGLDTINGIINKWAPPNENNTKAYVAGVAGKTGFNANQKLDLNDQKTVAPLISAIIKQEGNGAAYSDDMVQQAVARQMAQQPGNGAQSSQKLDVSLTLHGLPPGVSASARTAAGQDVAVRVERSMPPGITP